MDTFQNTTGTRGDDVQTVREYIIDLKKLRFRFMCSNQV
jgi:hypothetical protein